MRFGEVLPHRYKTSGIARRKGSHRKSLSPLRPSSVEYLPSPSRCHPGTETVGSFSLDVAQVCQVLFHEKASPNICKLPLSP